MIIGLETSEGVVGWGDVTGSCDEPGLLAVLEEMKDYMVGKDALLINECTSPLRKWSYPHLDTIRAQATALSGIDQALWDAMAKHYKLPLYKLYGADGRTRIPLYANLNKALRNNRSMEKMAEHAKSARALGFRMVKVTPFDEITPMQTEEDMDRAFERIEAVTSVVPVKDIAIDCHQRFVRVTLARMVDRLLDNVGMPYWIEDPVAASDIEVVRIMTESHPDIRWATGEEALTMRGLLRMGQDGCYDVLIPDVKYVGGPSVLKSAIPALEAMGRQVSLHNPNGIIATAHSAHLMALCEHPTPMEFPFAAVPDRDLLSGGGEVIKDGWYQFTGESGIGVSLAEDVMKEYACRFVNGKWVSFA